MTMAMLKKTTPGSDDEEDLEFLRLAALKSLKPKQTCVIQNKPIDNIYSKQQHSYKPSTFGAAQTTRHHNRGFRNNAGRLGRNGLCSRARTNTNLISIPIIDNTEPKEVVKEPVLSEAPKLILPQDRYHKPNASISPAIEPTSTVSNKFNRYDNSENESESDSDEIVTKPTRRERKDSLEMLMDEIDNEINVLDGKVDVKEAESDSKELDDDKPSNLQATSETSDSKPVAEPEEEIKEANDTLIIEAEPDLVQNDEPSSLPKVEEEPKVVEEKQFSPVYKSRSRSPFVSSDRSHNNKRKSRSRSPVVRSRSPFESQYKSPYRSPRRSRSPPRKVRYSPGHYTRPLSPLALNTEVLNTITMAPLSPRSAAFVLENRQILARRQMSPPRRSLSRESSCRRSLTPKRNKLSPRRRSRSPRFESSRKCSLSPRKRSVSPRLSPKRRSTSPRNYHRRSPNYKSDTRTVKRNSDSPQLKQPVHKRLGSRPDSRNPSPHYEYDRKTELPQGKRKRASRSMSLSLSPSPDRNYHKRPLNETTGHVNNDARRARDKPRKESPKPKPEEKQVDPILEARKRKFESPVQIEKNGIIKLKSNKSNESDEAKEESEESPQKEEYEDEDETEEVDDSILDLNPTLDDLWSDEESDNENEGRFKSKPSSQNKNVTVLPFRKLTEKPIPKEPLLPKDPNDYRSDRKYSRRQKNYPRRRSRTPAKKSESKHSKQERETPVDSALHRDRVPEKSVESKSKTKTSDKVRSKSVEDDKKKEKSVVNVINVKSESSEVSKTVQPEKSVRRKVKIQKTEEAAVVVPEVSAAPEEETEIIVEDEDSAVTKDDDGDLRAELSRRRAQRLIKAGSLAESLPARLLKNALQDAVPKRSMTKQTKIAKGSGSSADRRVLILKRLASSPAPQLDPATKVSSKDGKLPIHMRLGSSTAEPASGGETVVAVRAGRTKRSRSGRRKKAAVQV